MDIFKAIQNNDINKVKEFLDSGLDVNIQDNDLETPLYIACNKNNIEILKLLLEHPNININIQDDSGWTPLHIACASYKLRIAELLLNHPDIDVNIRAKNNKITPLFLACRNNENIAIVKLLLKRPEIIINFDYRHFNFTLRNLLKSHTNKYKISVNKILDSIED